MITCAIDLIEQKKIISTKSICYKICYTFLPSNTNYFHILYFLLNNAFRFKIKSTSIYQTKKKTLQEHFIYLYNQYPLYKNKAVQLRLEYLRLNLLNYE